MRSFSNNAALVASIQQLDQIALEVQSNNLTAVEREEKPNQILQDAHKLSINFLLAIHYCRMGYLFAKNEKWNEAAKYFSDGMKLFKYIPKNKLSHEHLIFFSQAAFKLSRISSIHLADPKSSIKLLKMARDLIFHIKKESRTEIDTAYLLLYHSQVLYMKLNLDKIKIELSTVLNTVGEYDKVWSKYLNNLKKFFVKYRHSPRDLKQEVDLQIDCDDEACKARDLFLSAADSISELNPSALQGQSIFRNIALERVAIQPEKKTVLMYSFTR